MQVIIFIILLGILIFVHELGHFLFAKMFGIRVDEFGFGYPPRAKKIGRWRGTDITLNWIPFGGFVKIFGEADTGEALSDAEKEVSLVHKPRWQQFLVMIGGVLFNVLLAMIVLAVMYMSGVASTEDMAPKDYHFDDLTLQITGVLPDTPAELAGFQAGDEIKEYYNSIESVTVTDQEVGDFASFVNITGEAGDTIGVVVLRDEKLEVLSAEPELGLVSDAYALGVSLGMVGELKLPFFQAISYGVRNSLHGFAAIVRSFGQLIAGSVSIKQLSGPIGIIGQVGQASSFGFLYLLGFMAFLSLNLAVLNLIPFPALDGGRILVIIIEGIIQKRIAPRIVNGINSIGFILLILLMLLVTVKDVIQLF